MIGKLSQIDQLSSILSQSQIRHEVISSNLAHVNDPGYKTKGVKFADVLAEAGEQIDQVGEIFEVDGLKNSQNGNNVDMDRELSSMSKNALAFQTYSQLMASKIGAYRTAISGRS